MSVGKIINSPSGDIRSVLQREYNASLKTFQGFWSVVESNVGLFVGRLESINPLHGDIVLNSVSRVDVKCSFDKVWIRGSQVKSLYVLGGKDRDRAERIALRILSGLHRDDL
ncbi:MAG TPA: hypothetical protein ENF42_01430 [Candidatus Bathyarchaeota archaeon]|nr:hypothetical protein [Candidatus Bathyarchaeota archaeon]